MLSSGRRGRGFKSRHPDPASAQLRSPVRRALLLSHQT